MKESSGKGFTNRGIRIPMLILEQENQYRRGLQDRVREARCFIQPDARLPLWDTKTV
jgi:hypothetical protein